MLDALGEIRILPRQTGNFLGDPFWHLVVLGPDIPLQCLEGHGRGSISGHATSISQRIPNSIYHDLM